MKISKEDLDNLINDKVNAILEEYGKELDEKEVEIDEVIKEVKNPLIAPEKPKIKVTELSTKAKRVLENLKRR